ncbi:uncharacterized protein [Lepeophtheirus salmonis]|uniref:uncharacterized protein n=1 Tax=Lepeophtheirus salmonis TaxID=72036 RepID=UPI001AE68DDF|nr:capping protein inhibiting regulator of actin dynamics-like [Lepeophtheirus salmonis]
MKFKWVNILFWISLLIFIVNGRPQMTEDELYGDEFHDDMISEDYDDYYDLEEIEDIPTTIAPDGRRLPWYFTSRDGQDKEAGEDEYVGGVEYEEDYDDIDYAEEDRLREEARLEKYRQEEEKRRQEEEAARLMKEEKRRQEEEAARLMEEESRKNLEKEDEKRRLEEEEIKARRLEEEERRKKIIDDQRQREELAEKRREKMEEKKNSEGETKPDGDGDTTLASTQKPSEFNPEDPYNPQNGGNLLVHLGHRREDNSCPYGWVMDIYGYCRSIFKEENRDWEWWEHIRRHVISQQGHYNGHY